MECCSGFIDDENSVKSLEWEEIHWRRHQTVRNAASFVIAGGVFYLYWSNNEGLKDDWLEHRSNWNQEVDNHIHYSVNSKYARYPSEWVTTRESVLCQLLPILLTQLDISLHWLFSLQSTPFSVDCCQLAETVTTASRNHEVRIIHFHRIALVIFDLNFW